MSDFLRDEFYKNHRILPQYLIPDAIDATLFPKEETAKTIDILGAGGLHALKRYDMFVEVVAAIARRISLLNAMLCGGGELEGKIKQQIVESGLQNILQCTGMIPHKEVLKQMKSTKAFLYTSSLRVLAMCV